MSEKVLVDREQLERAASVIAWMSCRSDIKAADLKRLEQCASELSCALTAPAAQAEPVAAAITEKQVMTAYISAGRLHISGTSNWVAAFARSLNKQIAAAPAAPEADLSRDERVAALCDLSYRAGLKAGWNYCAAGDEAGFARSMESARAAVAVLNERRRKGAPAAPVVQAERYGSYVTTPGESVAGIAARQLGDQSRWIEIRDLNALEFPDMGPHDYYPVGTKLVMPKSAPPAQPDAPRCQCCGYLVTQSEHRGCLRSASPHPVASVLVEALRAARHLLALHSGEAMPAYDAMQVVDRIDAALSGKGGGE